MSVAINRPTGSLGNAEKDKEWAAKLDDYVNVLVSEGISQKTLNGYGWHINMLDSMQEKFLDYAKTCTRPIADLGCGFGYSSRALLENSSVPIIANDLSQGQLDELRTKVTDPSQEARLITRAGNALDLTFEENSLDGIQALRWFYYLRPEEIRDAFQKFYRWLAPGGKVFINVFSPHYLKFYGPDFLAVYEQRVANGDEWPGLMDPSNAPWLKSGVTQDYGYMMDKTVFKREAERGGFTIEFCDYYIHPVARSREEGEHFGKEMMGLVAVKPK